MNESKKSDPRFWRLWRASGSIGRVPEDPIKLNEDLERRKRERLKELNLPPVEVNFVDKDDTGSLAVDFYAYPSAESEELCANLRRQLAHGEVTINTPDYGDLLEITFADENRQLLAVVPITN